MGVIVISAISLSLLIVGMFDLKRALGVYIFLWMFLPDIFALDIGYGFPVLMYRRILFAIVILLWFARLLMDGRIVFEIKRMYWRKDFTIFVGILLALTIVTLTPIRGFMYLFSIVIEQFILFAVVWSLCETKQDIYRLIHTVFAAFAIVTMYGFYVKLSMSNPFLEGSTTLTGDELNVLYDSRAGVEGRVSATFHHPIIYGGYLVIVLPFLLAKLRLIHSPHNIGIVTLVILVCTNLIFTNSRTPIAAAIAATIFMLIQGARRKALVVITLILGGVLLLAVAELLKEEIPIVYSTIFFWKEDAAIAGSSLEMRALMLASTYTMFVDSPILGNGLTFLRNYLAESGMKSELWGGESIIVPILIDTGLIGLIAYTVLYFKLGRRLWQMRSEGVSAVTKNYIGGAISAFIAWLLFAIVTGDLNTFSFLLVMIALASKLHLLDTFQERMS